MNSIHLSLAMNPSIIMVATDPKRKCQQYLLEYLKLYKIYFYLKHLYPQLQMKCLICESVYSSDAMKPTKMKGHLQRIHPDKKK